RTLPVSGLHRPARTRRDPSLDLVVSPRSDQYRQRNLVVLVPPRLRPPAQHLDHIHRARLGIPNSRRAPHHLDSSTGSTSSLDRRVADPRSWRVHLCKRPRRLDRACAPSAGSGSARAARQSTTGPATGAGNGGTTRTAATATCATAP